MATPLKRPENKTGHSKGKAERPKLGIVPARPVNAPVPKPPAGLLARSRRVWRSYWQSQVANAADELADTHRLIRWIQYVDEYERVYDVFRKTRLVKGSMGQPVLNPLGAYLVTVEGNINRAENEMGLTPLARLRLGITYGQAMLTASALNQALDRTVPEELPAADAEQDVMEGQWEAV